MKAHSLFSRITIRISALIAIVLCRMARRRLMASLWKYTIASVIVVAMQYRGLYAIINP